ncbi:MAG TPA: hypothetical protein PKE00_00625 [Planctomycetota bacterium]|nr:hypothetical protein [Planctomycetota bacterium]
MKTLACFAIGALALVAGRMTHSAAQTQLFPGSAIKVAPDPSNIWSFHQTTQTTNGKVVIPVVVDFDANNKSDSELVGARILVSEVQLVTSFGRGIMRVVDSGGPRWELHTAPNQQSVDRSFATPIAIPVGSKFEVEVLSDAPVVTVNLSGRLVTL